MKAWVGSQAPEVTVTKGLHLDRHRIVMSKLNKATVAAVTVPPGKSETIAWDDDIPGFGLRVRAGGSRVWIFRYRLGPKQRVMTFGSADVITAQIARETAVKLHAQVKLGLDPAGDKAKARVEAAAAACKANVIADKWLDFAERGIEPTCFLYRHYDARGLYVGMSAPATNRLRR